MPIPTRYDSAGRVQPTEYRNLIAPAECLLCKRIGHTPDEVFANIGVELDYYGQCYLCTDCCFEIAAFVLCVPSDQHNTLLNEYSLLKNENSTLVGQVDYLKGLLNARINSAGSGEPDSDGSVSVPLLEVDSTADEIDRILNADQPKSA